QLSTETDRGHATHRCCSDVTVALPSRAIPQLPSPVDMLLDTIRALFQSGPGTNDTPPRALPVAEAPTAPDALGIEPVALAACVLLLDLAHADGEFSPAEQAHLERVLERYFGVPAAT